jgi:uncharacterized protein
MLSEERVRLGVAAAAFVVVYGGALGFLCHGAFRGVQRRRGKVVGELARATRRARVAVYLVAALGIGCAAYARWIEPYWPDVTHVELVTDKLGSDAGRIRIAHISDVHSDPEERLEGRLPDLVAGESPDLIVFTGDSINAPEGAANFRRLMSRLAAIAPTYAVRGNWDVWYWNAIDLFGGTGVTELDGKAVRVPLGRGPRQGPELWIAGVAAGSAGQIPRVLASIPHGALSVLLHHYPDEIGAAAGQVDLYCAGHTHGGQVALPFYGALVTLSRFGKRYESGLHREGSTWLYVNRGIGMEGGGAPRVRFFARPEITIIELRPAGGPVRGEGGARSGPR